MVRVSPKASFRLGLKFFVVEIESYKLSAFVFISMTSSPNYFELLLEMLVYKIQVQNTDKFR